MLKRHNSIKNLLFCNGLNLTYRAFRFIVLLLFYFSIVYLLLFKLCLNVYFKGFFIPYVIELLCFIVADIYFIILNSNEIHIRDRQSRIKHNSLYKNLRLTYVIILILLSVVSFAGYGEIGLITIYSLGWNEGAEINSDVKNNITINNYSLNELHSNCIPIEFKFRDERLKNYSFSIVENLYVYRDFFYILWKRATALFLGMQTLERSKKWTIHCSYIEIRLFLKIT